MLNQTIPSKQHMVLVTVGLYQGHCLTDKLNNIAKIALSCIF